MKVLHDDKPFPIQGDTTRANGDHGPMVRIPKTYVPWWLAEIAYEADNCKDQQTLERIAVRGGYGREEFVKLIRREGF